MESIIIAVIAIIFSLVQSRMNKDEKEQPTSTKPIQQEIPQTMRVEPVEKQVQVREITPRKRKSLSVLILRKRKKKQNEKFKNLNDKEKRLKEELA
ncbi:hypothetical protein [Bacillus coahuilensis]|uniref:hypothetical protein n=1 Tax=Bacillus coahuilensis TaxID=408580 RepID=UPI0001850FB3|nr:hypothetical protein [Bacillus coahuilensis]